MGDESSDRKATGPTICRNCGKREVEPERECYATPVCFACLPPPRPLPVRRKCAYCIHDEHIGLCHGRNGGTAYACPCFHSTVSR